MHIVLVSEDQELRQLCNDVLNELPGPGWRLTVAGPGNWPADGDLYIWDDCGRTAPAADSDLSWPRHLFVVHRDDVTLAHVPETAVPAAILLKPVTRARLAVFLEMATAAPMEHRSPAGSRRAHRDELLQCLIQSNLQIQRYDQDRTNFLARAAHDFRAPLMTAIGYCELLLNEALGPQNDGQKEVLRRMLHSVRRLSRTSTAMFELSVGNRMKREPELREADIRECAEQALHEVGPIAKGKGIAISVEMEAATGCLLIEPGRMEQVLVNILENACKFTPRGGEVEIRGRPYFWDRRRSAADGLHGGAREFNSYRLDIRDSGPRIPPEHLARIFEEYTSYGGGPDRSGGGLGLAICRMILGSHGGCIWAENSDAGPRFSFVLPYRASQVEPDGRLKTIAAAP